MALKSGESWDDTLSLVLQTQATGRSNTLKLDHSKTELIMFSPKQPIKETDNLPIEMSSSYKQASASERNLEFVLH